MKIIFNSQEHLICENLISQCYFYQTLHQEFAENDEVMKMTLPFEIEDTSISLSHEFLLGKTVIDVETIKNFIEIWKYLMFLGIDEKKLESITYRLSNYGTYKTNYQHLKYIIDAYYNLGNEFLILKNKLVKVLEQYLFSQTYNGIWRVNSYINESNGDSKMDFWYLYKFIYLILSVTDIENKPYSMDNLIIRKLFLLNKNILLNLFDIKVLDYDHILNMTFSSFNFDFTLNIIKNINDFLEIKKYLIFEISKQLKCDDNKYEIEYYNLDNLADNIRKEYNILSKGGTRERIYFSNDYQDVVKDFSVYCRIMNKLPIKLMSDDKNFIEFRIQDKIVDFNDFTKEIIKFLKENNIESKNIEIKYTPFDAFLKVFYKLDILGSLYIDGTLVVPFLLKTVNITKYLYSYVEYKNIKKIDGRLTIFSYISILVMDQHFNLMEYLSEWNLIEEFPESKKTMDNYLLNGI